MENKNKAIATIVAVVFLIALVIGASAAYFGIWTLKDYKSDAITALSEKTGTIAIISTNNNMSINLTREDMKRTESDIVYYASSNGKTTIETTEAIATTQTIENGEYNCKYTLNVEATNSSLYSAFQNMAEKTAGQIVLTIDGKEYDFSAENLFPLQINGKLTNVTKYNPKNIYAQLKVVNTARENQSEFAGKPLELTFSIERFTCAPSAVKDNILAGVANVSEELVGGLYRFQGDADTVNNNYLCFGTNSKENCTTGDMKEAYLYRIIGVNEDNEIKIILNSRLLNYYWHSEDQNIEWPNSYPFLSVNQTFPDLINGKLSEGAPKYYYDGWEDLVVDTSWKYGDIYEDLMDHYTQTGDDTSINGDFIYGLESKFTKKITAKMGLMYAHDYFYSGNEDRCLSSTYKADCKNNWLHISHTGYDDTEWTMTRAGYINSYLYGMAIESNGLLQMYSGTGSLALRPVMYLKDTVTLTGEGTLENPYIVVN